MPSALASAPVTASVLLLIAEMITHTLGQSLLHTVSHSIGAGNFTYYELHDMGDVDVVLDSLKGDTDLYISDISRAPDYYDYELQSVTCGLDQVSIPSSMTRPVTIGVYGHSSYDVSQYVLRIFAGTPSVHPEYPTGNDASDTVTASGSKRNPSKAAGGRSVVDPKEDDESLLWTIFVGILKVLFDVLV